MVMHHCGLCKAGTNQEHGYMYVDTSQLGSYHSLEEGSGQDAQSLGWGPRSCPHL